jgi:RHS repeat-associated protein
LSATETHYDVYGNVTYSARYDFGGTSPTTATTTTYYQAGTTCGALSSGSHINNKPCEIATTQNGSTVVDAKYTYDQYGNLKTTSLWNGTSWIGQTSANTYNSNGTALKLFDTANNETDYTYSPTGYVCSSCTPTNYPFPTKITNVGTGLVTQATWNAVGGVKLTDVDANGNVTTYSYDENCGSTADPFWRVGSITDPMSNVVCKTYPTGRSPDTWGSTFPFNSSNSVHNMTQTTDGYGRRVNAQKQQSPTATQYDTVSTSYGWSSPYRTVATSQPCSAALAGTCPTAHTNYFDPLGRLYQEATTSNETLTHTYTQNDDLIVLGPAPSGDGENTKQVQNQYDGLGRLQYSCAIGNGSSTACAQNTGSANGATTSYAYSQVSGYTTVALTLGSQTRTNRYDAMGRLTTKSTPEGGTWNYYYDSTVASVSCSWLSTPNLTGRLAMSKDPNSNYICYSYDALGRMLQANANGTTCRHFYYDASTGYSGTIPSGITISYSSGRMAEAATDACSSGTLITDEWFSYDKDGRLTDIWELTPYLKSNSLGYYHTNVGLFGNGALNTLSGIPGFTTETYGLDGEGRLSTAQEGLTDMMITGVVYNAASQPTAVSLGSANGTDNDAYTYDSNTGRMKTWTFTVGSSYQTGTLNWNPIGTLGSLAIVDHFNSVGTLTCNFGTSGHMGYDDWNRLLYDDCGSGNWGQQYSYDQYDNLTKSGISGRTGTTFNPGYNSANNQFASGFGASYDSDGNLTYDTYHHYAWSEYDKLKSVDGSGTNCASGGNCFVSDALGRVVEIDSGSTASEILYSPAGKTAVMNGTTVTYAYIPMPGGSIMYKPNDTTHRYWHLDWLGSTRVVSTLSSVVQEGYWFSPYGEILSGNSYGSITNEVNFTGDTQDLVPGGGLFDTPNRELSFVGRWINPDPAAVGHNLYAYPTNPNGLIDPSGLCPPGQVSCGGSHGPGGVGCTDRQNPNPTCGNSPNEPTGLGYFTDTPGGCAAGCTYGGATDAAGTVGADDDAIDIGLTLNSSSGTWTDQFGNIYDSDGNWIGQNLWNMFLGSGAPSDASLSLLVGTLNSPSAGLNDAVCSSDPTCGLVLGIGLAMLGDEEGLGIVEEEGGGLLSTYLETTDEGARIPNFETNTTAEEAAANLEANGFTPTTTSDGQATIFTNANGDQYVLRPSDSAPGGSALDYQPGGGPTTVKINLGGSNSSP